MEDLRDKIGFSVQEAAQARNITEASARVWCSREAAKGNLLRLKNNLYIDAQRWKYLLPDERLRLANIIQVASYLSMSTVLAYRGLTTQIYRGQIESIAQVRSIQYTVDTWRFRYFRIQPELYGGFERENGLFIASAPKALADIVYFCSIGKYAFDFQAVEWRRFDLEAFKIIISGYPQKTQDWWEKYGDVSATRNF
jgi:hypothetical protein